MDREYLLEKLLNVASSLANGGGALRNRLEDAASNAALSSAMDKVKELERHGLDPRSEVSQRLRVVVDRLLGSGTPRERIARMSDEECRETANTIFELYAAEERRQGHLEALAADFVPDDPFDPIERTNLEGDDDEIAIGKPNAATIAERAIAVAKSRRPRVDDSE